jgi:hypothetical protein
MSYEDAPYSFDAMFGIATPGAGPGFKRDWAGPLDTAPVPRINTFEYNQTGYAYTMNGEMLTTLEITIESAKLWTFIETYLGKWFVPGTLTTLAARSVEAIKAADTMLYVDPFGTAGGAATLLDKSGIKAVLKLDSRRHLKQFIGNALPQDWGFDQYQGTLALTLELNTATKALLDLIAVDPPQTFQRLFRFTATHGAKIAQLDFAGVLENPDELFGDRDGNETLTLNFKSKTDLTGLGNWFKASVTNGVATLP